MMRRLLLLLLGRWTVITRPVQAQEGGQTHVVTAGELPAAVAAAAAGDTIEVNGGILQGSLEIDKRVTVIGQGRGR